MANIIDINRRNVYIAKSKNNYGLSYFAKRNFKRGEYVMSGFGKIINHQTPALSIQIDSNKHFLPRKWRGHYWNHSCSPNTYVHTRTNGFPDLITLRDIKKDEEITYAYYMTEYQWSKDAKENYIKCKCNTKKCVGKILSFSQLPKRKQMQLVKRKMCSNYLKNAL